MNRITIVVAIGLILAVIIVGARYTLGEREPVPVSRTEQAPAKSSASKEPQRKSEPRFEQPSANLKTEVDEQPANTRNVTPGEVSSPGPVINMDDLPPGPAPSMDPGPAATVDAMTNPAEVSVSQPVYDDPLGASSAAPSADPGPSGNEEILADPAQ